MFGGLAGIGQGLVSAEPGIRISFIFEIWPDWLSMQIPPQTFYGIQRFIDAAEASDSDILGRFYDRVRFEIAHENRSDLSYLLEAWHGEDGLPMPDRSKKKIAMIYGSEVNLLDGEWRKASDGRRFWVSNEYPDIVLSAAEYKKYLNSATTVED